MLVCLVIVMLVCLVVVMLVYLVVTYIITHYHQYSNENPQSDCAESDSEIKRSGGRGGGEEGVEGEGLVVLKKERLPIFTNSMPKP